MAESRYISCSLCSGKGYTEPVPPPDDNDKIILLCYYCSCSGLIPADRSERINFEIMTPQDAKVYGKQVFDDSWPVSVVLTVVKQGHSPHSLSNWPADFPWLEHYSSRNLAEMHQYIRQVIRKYSIMFQIFGSQSCQVEGRRLRHGSLISISNFNRVYPLSHPSRVRRLISPNEFRPPRPSDSANRAGSKVAAKSQSCRFEGRRLRHGTLLSVSNFNNVYPSSAPARVRMLMSPNELSTNEFRPPGPPDSANQEEERIALMSFGTSRNVLDDRPELTCEAALIAAMATISAAPAPPRGDGAGYEDDDDEDAAGASASAARVDEDVDDADKSGRVEVDDPSAGKKSTRKGKSKRRKKSSKRNLD